MRGTLILSALLLAMQVEVVPQPEIRTISGTLTATQVRKLNATPVTVVAIPGSGNAIVLESAQFMLDYGGTVYDSVGSGEDLIIWASTNENEIARCDESTCLIGDSTSDTYGLATFNSNATFSLGQILRDNRGLEVTIASGEWATTDDDSDGNSPIHYLIRYRVVSTDIS